MKVIITPEAATDLKSIWSWNAKYWGVRQADAYSTFLEKSIRALSRDHARGKHVSTRADLSYLSISSTRAISGSIQPAFGPYSGMNVGVTGAITIGGAITIRGKSPENMPMVITGNVKFGGYQGGLWNFTGLIGSGSQSVGSNQEAATILLGNTAYGQWGA